MLKKTKALTDANTKRTSRGSAAAAPPVEDKSRGPNGRPRKSEPQKTLIELEREAKDKQRKEREERLLLREEGVREAREREELARVEALRQAEEEELKRKKEEEKKAEKKRRRDEKRKADLAEKKRIAAGGAPAPVVATPKSTAKGAVGSKAGSSTAKAKDSSAKAKGKKKAAEPKEPLPTAAPVAGVEAGSDEEDWTVSFGSYHQYRSRRHDFASRVNIVTDDLPSW